MKRGAGRARGEQSIHKRLRNVSRIDVLEHLKVSASPVVTANPSANNVTRQKPTTKT